MQTLQMIGFTLLALSPFLLLFGGVAVVCVILIRGDNAAR